MTERTLSHSCSCRWVVVWLESLSCPAPCHDFRALLCRVLGDGLISVNGKEIKIVSSRDPLQLPWKEMVCQLALPSPLNQDWMWVFLRILPVAFVSKAIRWHLSFISRTGCLVMSELAPWLYTSHTASRAAVQHDVNKWRSAYIQVVICAMRHAGY